MYQFFQSFGIGIILEVTDYFQIDLSEAFVSRYLGSILLTSFAHLA